MIDKVEEVDTIFCVAIEMEDAELRAGYVEKACDGNVKLKEKIDKLLSAHFEAGGFLTDTDQLAGVEWHLKTGSQVGRYKLREKIGEGGFGVVYVAEQKVPVSRKVALKVIKPGMDSQDIIARFEAERQALAMMDHPNVAKVLDAGATESGRPYFVMELVHGVSITEYCDSNRLTNRQRLELFIDVCHAVQHSHQKGIIHRDIKPSNVMVTMADHRPVVKVIDFGVAKALHQNLTDKSIYTGYGQLVGTPMYMSPEQAQMSSLDVDTRSDIYSLGVLLYELLTGTPPFDKDTFKKVDYDEVRRMIREVEPRRPSEQVSTLKAEQASTISDSRNVNHGSLGKSLRGDLDWIVMKALEKDRSRRYETVNGLAEDIGRFLGDQPVVARAPSRIYRLRKFIRRNRPQLVAATVAGIALFVGVIGLAMGLWQASQSEKLAQQRLRESQSAKKLESKQREKAEAITAFVSEDFLELKSVPSALVFNEEPVNELTSNLTYRELLDRAAEKLAARSDVDPAIGSELNWMIGKSYEKLDENNTAIVHFQKSLDLANVAFGEQHPKTHVTGFFLAKVYLKTGRYDDALRLAKRNVDFFRSKYGPKDANTISNQLLVVKINQRSGKEPLTISELEDFVDVVHTSLNGENSVAIECRRVLADVYKSARMDKQAIGERETIVAEVESKFGTNHFASVVANFRLAESLASDAQYDRALEVANRAVEVLEQTTSSGPTTVINGDRLLASILRSSGQTERATKLIQSALDRARDIFGEEHSVTLRCLHELAKCYFADGKLEQASELFHQVLAIQKESDARLSQISTLNTMSSLASLHSLRGNMSEAVGLREKIVAQITATKGKDHPSTRAALFNLASEYQRSGNNENAFMIFEKLLPKFKENRGEVSEATLKSMIHLGMAYVLKGNAEQGLPLMEQAFATIKQEYSRDHPQTKFALEGLATANFYANRLDQSIPLFEELLELQLDEFGPDHPRTLRTKANLGVNYAANERPKDAVTLMEAAYYSKRGGGAFFLGPELAGVYMRLERHQQATDLAEKHLAESRKRYPTESPQLAKVLSRICGAFFIPNEDFSKAEELLRESLTVLKQQSPNDWLIYAAQSRLGKALTGQEKYKESEENLLAANLGLEKHKAELPPNQQKHIGESVENLIELYSSWHNSEPSLGYDRKANQWKNKLEGYETAQNPTEKNQDEK